MPASEVSVVYGQYMVLRLKSPIHVKEAGGMLFDYFAKTAEQARKISSDLELLS